MRMIPRIIHYCWFGGNEKPDNIKRYMQSWKDMLEDYEFIEWNENNFNIDEAPNYVKEAYEARKFAFVSDYARLKALYEYGGVYLDTDVEIIKPFDELLEEKELVTGFETLNTLITAFIACNKGNRIIGEFLESYNELKFLSDDGSYDMTPINNRFTDLMVKYGLVINNERQSLCGGLVEIYPFVVFAGNDIENAHVKITEETCTIHRFQSSWKKMTPMEILKFKIIIPRLQKILGYDRYDKLKNMMK